MKIEYKKNCKSMMELGDIEYGTVIRHDGRFYLVSDEGANEGLDLNCDSDKTQLVVDLEEGNVIGLSVDEKFEIVKAKVVIE